MAAMSCMVLMVAEKPSLAQSIAQILSNGKVRAATTSPSFCLGGSSCCNTTNFHP